MSRAACNGLTLQTGKRNMAMEHTEGEMMSYYNPFTALDDADFDAFIRAKEQQGANHGFEPTFMPDGLFDCQEAMTVYAIEKGRSALFEDCGLGKSVQLLTWAQNVVEHTNKPVLVLTPLAVGGQMVREADKFGIEAHQSRDGAVGGDIVVTNYEKLALFDSDDFSGVVCDESSILKSLDGAMKDQITDFMRKTPYRLLTTATAAPNDYIELGTSSEALGYMGFMDMLNRFFINDQNNSSIRQHFGEAPKWRFKGHSELPFWRWVCSWSRSMRKPSDLGFEDGDFILPELNQNMHLVSALTRPEGELFELPAMTLPEQREEKKRTVTERCEKVASLVDHGDQALVWCQRNDEADMLEEIIPDAIQVAGRHSDEKKEDRFMGFSSGDIRVLVTKPKIGGLGMNWQNCNHITYFPTHSFEAYYQAIRRCWRFGQKRDVQVDVVHTEGESRIMANLERKAEQADRMFTNLVAEMNNAISFNNAKEFNQRVELPKWQ